MQTRCTEVKKKIRLLTQKKLCKSVWLQKTKQSLNTACMSDDFRALEQFTEKTKDRKAELFVQSKSAKQEGKIGKDFGYFETSLVS